MRLLRGISLLRGVICLSRRVLVGMVVVVMVRVRVRVRVMGVGMGMVGRWGLGRLARLRCRERGGGLVRWVLGVVRLRVRLSLG